MSPRYAVIGPLREPAIRSGVHGGYGRWCACTATYGEECSRCSGVGDDDRAVAREARPRSAGRGLSDVEVMRLVEACRPTTPYYAEEAS